MRDFIDKTTETNGTPINRKNLMAVQGFDNKTTEINEDGNYVVETNSDQQTLTTEITENEDGSITITEIFVGDKTITKTTIIDSDGVKVSEVLS